MPSTHPDASPTPASLLLRLHAGTDDEWGRFWGIYGPFIFRLARRAGLNRPDADDIVALVSQRLVTILRSGFARDPAKGRFRSYVATLTRNALIDRARRQARRQVRTLSDPGGVADEALSVESELARLERIERLNLCLERLRASPRVRQRSLLAFERYVLQGEPVAEVARALDLTPARVHSIRHEMLRRIEKLMLQLDLELGEV